MISIIAVFVSRLNFAKAETRDSLQDATTAIFQRGVATLNPSVSVCNRL